MESAYPTESVPAGVPRPAVVGDDQVRQRPALALQGGEDGLHRVAGVGVPQRGAVLQDRHVRELHDVPLVRLQPVRDDHDLAAGRAQRAGGGVVDLQEPAGMAGREEHPLLPVRRLAQPGRHPLQAADGQLRVDGVLAVPVLRVVVDPHPLRHHREHVLLVVPAVAELQTEPVVAVAVRQLAVVGEVVLTRGGDLARDTGLHKVVD